jgi:hypothetical protein
LGYGSIGVEKKGRMSMTVDVKFGPNWDVKFQFGEDAPEVATRQQYEAACVTAGIRPDSDDDIWESGVDAEYDMETWRNKMTRNNRISWVLNAARFRVIKAEKAALRAAKTQEALARPPAPKGYFGLHGIRYDEGCERCGRTGEVDNRTGLCQKCWR